MSFVFGQNVYYCYPPSYAEHDGAFRRYFLAIDDKTERAIALQNTGVHVNIQLGLIIAMLATYRVLY